MARTPKKSAAETFRDAFGRGDPYRKYTQKDEKRLGTRVPEVMREILKKDGWCSYRDQVLWMCDPDDWALAARAWLPDAAAAEVLLRTALGDLVIWDGQIFWFAMVHEPLVMMTVDNADWFFSRTLPAPDFAPQTYLPAQVRAAREQAGALKWDEMYTYVPALALGGSPEYSQVERVKALEALAMLSQLAPIRRQ